MRSNIEKSVIQHLSRAMEPVAVRAYVPAEKPKRLLTVERVGGESDGVALDRPRIAIQSWAATLDDASELAIAADEAMASLVGSYGVTSVARESLYRHVTAAGEARYQAVYRITAHIDL